MSTLYRTHTADEISEALVGKEVSLAGWIENIRDHGGVSFIDLRDFYGVVQVVMRDTSLLDGLNKEDCISVSGVIEKRDEETYNPKIPSGTVELNCKSVKILGKVREQLPFEIVTSKETREDVRLRYRFLDLRNRKVKDNVVFRSQVIAFLREKMTEMGFLEVQTPILCASSPEGARDYIVPSRLYPGEFYALPQAPQQYKQLLMCSGFDRYFQIAPCFRDEDARADRSPGEFYQLDIEMAYATQEDVFEVLEGVLPPVFAKYSGKKADKPPFRRIPYREALETYGSDKPDLRNPLIIKDVTDLFEKSEFTAFHGKTVKAIAVPDFTGARKWIDKTAEDFKIKTEGGAMFWFRLDENAQPVGGITKFLTYNFDSLKERLNLKANSFVALVAEEKLSLVQKRAGILRTMLGTGLDLIEKDVFRFCWIVDFPMYEIGEESGQLEFCHNPFSMPQGGMEAFQKDPLEILAYQYDIVCNGIELSSGAVRNHDPEIMLKAFSLVGLGKEDVTKKFPALYQAFEFGAPPHAGVAPGVDRMVMLICETANIREVIPFPMNAKARDLLMNAPSPVEEKQLVEANIRAVIPEKKS